MKKFFLCVLILLGFFGFLFFTCWTQIKVKPQSFGVVVSKLSGINETPVTNGKFSFNREFLLPTNAELKIFTLKPVVSSKHIEGELPSADFYSNNGLYDFHYSFDFSFEAHVEPENVISLMKESKISNNEELQEYINRTGDSIVQDVAAYFLKACSEQEEFIPESLGIVDLYKACSLYENYPWLQIDVLALKASKIPDYRLYKAIRNRVLNGTDTGNNGNGSYAGTDTEIQETSGELAE